MFYPITPHRSPPAKCAKHSFRDSPRVFAFRSRKCSDVGEGRSDEGTACAVPHIWGLQKYKYKYEYKCVQSVRYTRHTPAHSQRDHGRGSRMAPPRVTLWLTLWLRLARAPRARAMCCVCRIGSIGNARLDARNFLAVTNCICICIWVASVRAPLLCACVPGRPACHSRGCVHVHCDPVMVLWPAWPRLGATPQRHSHALYNYPCPVRLWLWTRVRGGPAAAPRRSSAAAESDCREPEHRRGRAAVLGGDEAASPFAWPSPLVTWRAPPPHPTEAGGPAPRRAPGRPNRCRESCAGRAACC